MSALAETAKECGATWEYSRRMANKKNQQLNEAWVRRMAGEAYFARGLRYLFAAT